MLWRMPADLHQARIGIMFLPDRAHLARSYLMSALEPRGLEDACLHCQQCDGVRPKRGSANCANCANPRTGSHAAAVVRRLAHDLHVVHMALAQARAGDAQELAL